jgi:hypothetical protein
MAWETQISSEETTCCCKLISEGTKWKIIIIKCGRRYKPNIETFKSSIHCKILINLNFTKWTMVQFPFSIHSLFNWTRNSLLLWKKRLITSSWEPITKPYTEPDQFISYFCNSFIRKISFNSVVYLRRLLLSNGSVNTSQQRNCFL